MFASRETCHGAGHTVEVAFTDRWGGVTRGPCATLDLNRERPGDELRLADNSALLAEAFGVDGFATMRQVHGRAVTVVRARDKPAPTCDALVTDQPDIALCVRVADCLPLVLADVRAGVVGVAHVGRLGITEGVVSATTGAMRRLGADRIEAWLGPHVCAGCYEVPKPLRAAVAAAEPAAFACTTWGTPAVDIGAAVLAQLLRTGCGSVRWAAPCTLESKDFFSYRREGPSAGRQAGLVVLRRPR